MNKPLVIWHAHCWDGFCCAWLLKLVFPDAEFVPAQYGDAPPDCAGKQVYIVDFSYPRTVLFDIAHKARGLTVLDHHATAQADLAGFAEDALALGYCNDLPHIVFDMDKSGARLTWEFLHTYPQDRVLPPRAPWLVEYTEDRDLWRWALPSSREINAAIRSYPLDFAVWDNLAKHAAHEYIGEGTAILRREQQIIADHVAHAYQVDIGGYGVPCVNATTLFSDIAGELAVGQPFAVCFFQREDQRIQYSLRSDEQGIDVSELAKAYGGGGHAHAAGFTSDRLPANLGSPPGGWPGWEEGG